MDTNSDDLTPSTILDAGSGDRAATTATMEHDAGDPDPAATDPMNTDRNPQPPLWGPPPPPPPPRPRRSWLDVPIARDRADGRVAGVVAGVSRAYGFDRRTTRLAVALGVLVIPGIIAAYIAGIIFLPRSGDEPRTLRAIVTDRRRRPLMIVLGILAIATGFGSWAFWGGLGWGFGLVAIGVVLWLAPNLGRGGAVDRPSPILTDQPTTWSTPTTDIMSTPTTNIMPGSTTDVTSTPTAAPAAQLRRRRYPVQAVALGATSVGALVAVIGNNADWWSITTYAIVMAVLVALIAATVIGVIVNRSWFGIPMLVLLGACAVGLGVTHPNLDGGIGQRNLHPTTVADAQVDEHLGIGHLNVDLTDVPLGAQPLTVDASVGYGQIRVIVPADAELRLTTTVNAGRTVVDGDQLSAGIRRDDTRTIPADAPGTDGIVRTIDLDLEVGAGEIMVVRAG